jgi:hypothetical protein
MILYLRLLSLVHQAGQQAFGMINDLRRRLSKRGVGIVAEGHDASIGDLLGEEISQPERLRFGVCPGGEGVAAEAMHGYNTIARWHQ